MQFYSDASRVFLYYKHMKICCPYMGLRNTRHVTCWMILSSYT